jgi:hypothetical protein
LLGDVYRRTASGTSIDEPVLRLGGLDFYHLVEQRKITSSDVRRHLDPLAAIEAAKQ